MFDIVHRLARQPDKLLALLTPTGWAKSKKHLRGLWKNRLISIERERQAIEFHSDAWHHKPGFSQRSNLGDYSNHVARQSSKMARMVEDGLAKIDPATVERFRKRFALVPLDENSKILCLAARVGDEVLAWRKLGHPDAVGIDIAPGPDNQYVVVGDFHDLEFETSSIDCMYCNSLDHAFDLDKICSEVRRVIRPGGMFVLDIVYGYAETDSESYQVGRLDTTHWPTARVFGAVIAEKCGFDVEQYTDLVSVGSPTWVQCQLRKPV